jgi:hypothetical protein
LPAHRRPGFARPRLTAPRNSVSLAGFLEPFEADVYPSQQVSGATRLATDHVFVTRLQAGSKVLRPIVEKPDLHGSGHAGIAGERLRILEATVTRRIRSGHRILRSVTH